MDKNTNCTLFSARSVQVTPKSETINRVTRKSINPLMTIISTRWFVLEPEYTTRWLPFRDYSYTLTCSKILNVVSTTTKTEDANGYSTAWRGGKLFMIETNELISCSASRVGAQMSDRKCKSTLRYRYSYTKGARYTNPTEFSINIFSAKSGHRTRARGFPDYQA